MRALVTGASSGLGREISFILDSMGYDIVLVGRNKEELFKTKELLNNKITIVVTDLSKEENVYKLYKENKNIDLLVNSAGLGEIGEFSKTSKDLEIIDVNIKALHILTKLYLNDFIKKDSGRILNISSSAAFTPGPLMATYYASKSYVYSLTMAIYEELRRSNSNVKISVACPGAFNSNFLIKANINNATYVKDTKYIANYIVKKMFRNKTLIVPGFLMKLTILLNRLIPRKTMIKLNYNLQKKKQN